MNPLALATAPGDKQHATHQGAGTVPQKTKCLTEGCAGDPTATGCANGHCPRCYQWWRRHPNGPPPTAASLVTREHTMTLSIRVSPELKKAVRQVARKAGSPMQTWIRDRLAELAGIR